MHIEMCVDKHRVYGYVSCSYIIYHHLNQTCMIYDFALLKKDLAKWVIYYGSCNQFNFLQCIYYTYILLIYVRKTGCLSKPFFPPTFSSKVFWGWWPNLLRHIHLVRIWPCVGMQYTTWSDDSHPRWETQGYWRGSKGTGKKSHGKSCKQEFISTFSILTRFLGEPAPAFVYSAMYWKRTLPGC